MSFFSPAKTNVALRDPIKGKGLSFSHLRDFVCGRYGEIGWKRVLEDLKPDSREIFAGRILTSAWYPYEVYVEAEKLVVDRFLEGNIQRAVEIGAHDLEASLNTVYRAFYKVGSPAFIVRMSAILWRSYFSVGRMTIETARKDFAVARIEQFKPPAEVCCWDILGSIIRGLELSGASSVAAIHPECPLRGHSSMSFEARWVEGS